MNIHTLLMMKPVWDKSMMFKNKNRVINMNLLSCPLQKHVVLSTS